MTKLKEKPKPRWLRKDDGTFYAYSDALAKRGDMTEVKLSIEELRALQDEANGNDAIETEVIDLDADAIDPLAITDRDELKALLDERGVEYQANLGLVKLQQLLAAKLAEGAE